MQLIHCYIKKGSLLFIFWFSCLSLAAQVPNNTRGIITTSEATANAVTGDVYAIIMGVSTYPGVYPPLKFADKDAILFRDFLKTPSGGSTKPENILLLLNDSAKAADFNVRALGWLKNKNLKKGDRLYLYFSGHGVAMNEALYFFLPYDCEPNKDPGNYLGTGNINLYNVKVGFIAPQVSRGVDVILIMDACRSNEIPGGKEESGQHFSNKFIVQQEMGETMLLSTGPGQVSIESPTIGNGHGLFTYYLVDGLAGEADKDSLTGDNDGKVSLAEISAYVKSRVKRRARTDFNTVQIPFACCAEKDMATIVKVDPLTFTAWEYSKKIQQLSSDQNLFAVNNTRPGEKGVGAMSGIDTSQISLYNQFVDALKKEKLVGDASAETFYKLMEKNWPGNSITEDAKYSLAAKYLNFCQQKINLFLAGKGLVHIMYMEKEISKEQKDKDNPGITELGEQIKKLKTLVTTGFDVAAAMMEKAIDLMKNEPHLLEPVRPKYDFLKTMAAYSSKRSKLKDVLQYCRRAIEADPQSPSGYLLMGWIYQDMQDDSCEYYFRKAAAMAPKWAYPMNGLGNFYISKNNKKEAIRYFSKAISMDNLFSNAYRNLGMTYYNKKAFDSAKYYFKKAIDIDPCDSYANENYGSANAEYISQEFGSKYTDSVYFKIGRKFFLRSIECDSSFALGYQKMSALYSRARFEDSALAILQKCISVNPENADAYRNIGTYYLSNRKDSLQAEENFKKAITLDPSNGENYYSLARLYRKQKNKNKAIDIYTRALDNIGNNKDLFNELGNVYFEAPSQFEKAISYYNKALEMDPTLAYVYLNLGKLHEAKDVSKDSSIYYYSKAVLYDPDRFQKLNHTIADFYFDNKKFSEAKTFYRQSLEKPTPGRYWDVEHLVKILIEEKNFIEAESTLKQYLTPGEDKNLYEILSAAIKEASGQ
ncbi:MAG: tetratricopeptide repeat protein [Ferruginibacter sp.]